jgi:hypothetical protein
LVAFIERTKIRRVEKLEPVKKKFWGAMGVGQSLPDKGLSLT